MTFALGTPVSFAGSLVLLRHGETEWSRSGQHTGLTDVPLTPRGEELRPRGGDPAPGAHVRCRPHLPPRAGASYGGARGLAGAETEPRLVEWDYGGYEGLTTPEIRARVGHPWTVFANGVVPGDTPGETVQDVAGRPVA